MNHQQQSNYVYQQGDLVFLKKPSILPDGDTKKHPILIISSSSSNRHENYYTGVMMTSSTTRVDLFSIKCTDEMFKRKLDKKGCHLRLHIIIGFRRADIYNISNQMKQPFLSNVINQIKELIFSIE